MPYLTDAQRSLLAPASGPSPTQGMPVPTSNQAPFLNANSPSWALAGEYQNVDDPYTASTIYQSASGAFVLNAQGEPTGLNAGFFSVTDEVFPDSVQYHQALAANLPNAIGGDVAAQTACSLALMKLTACVNGQQVLPDDASNVYTMTMASASWYGWGQWAIGIQGPDGNITWQQKVTGASLQYNCGEVWNQGLPLSTTIRLNGLLQSQIDMLNRVV